MIRFTNREAAGLIPHFLSLSDPRPAKEQIHEGYAHDGGWRPFSVFQLLLTQNGLAWLEYPGDPKLYEISRAKFRSELLILFQFSWLAIIQPDDSFEISRLD